jgi:hypothetical protein
LSTAVPLLHILACSQPAGWLPNCCIVPLSNWLSVPFGSLSHCPIVPVLHCLCIPLPHCSTALLPTDSLSLSCCLLVTLPYCLNPFPMTSYYNDIQIWRKKNWREFGFSPIGVTLRTLYTVKKNFLNFFKNNNL